MGAVAVNTSQNSVGAGSAPKAAGGCGADVVPSQVLRGAPPAVARCFAFIVVVAKLLTVGTLCG